MALRGSLSEINIWDLIQLLRASGSTGELFVASLEAEARLVFDQGKVVAAASRQLEGREVLEAILGWIDGEFDFRRITEPALTPDPTLDDLLSELAAGRKRTPFGDNGRGKEPAVNASIPLDDPRCQQLAWFVESQPFVEHACLVDAEGTICAQSATNLLSSSEVRALALAVAQDVQSYPRPNLRRMILEDEKGIVVFTRMNDGSGLLLVADPKAPTGAVCSAANRLLCTLQE